MTLCSELDKAAEIRREKNWTAKKEREGGLAMKYFPSC